MKGIFFACHILLLAGAWSKAPAQYSFDLYDTNKGLPQNSITGLALFHDGYIWVTNNDGLARFDGVRFTGFNKCTNPEFTTNRLTGAFENKSNKPWKTAAYSFTKTVALKPDSIPTYLRSQFYDDDAGGPMLAKVKCNCLNE